MGRIRQLIQAIDQADVIVKAEDLVRKYEETAADLPRELEEEFFALVETVKFLHEHS